MKLFKPQRWLNIVIAVLLLTFLAFCGNQLPSRTQATSVHSAQPTANTNSELAQNPPNQNHNHSYHDADITFTLRTSVGNSTLLFVGEGGKIDGQNNPDLTVTVGQVAQIKLINGDGAEHDITIPDLNLQSGKIKNKGASYIVTFKADKAGTFTYFCSIPSHKEAGMLGRLIVNSPNVTQNTTNTQAANIIQLPTSVPEPVGKRSPKLVRLDLEIIELEGQLADGTTYNYWTYNGKVPGTFLRVHIGDTVELHIKNNPNSLNVHSIDLHAVTGQGGGAVLTQTSPGEEKVFTFKPLNPGLFVYHCATPMVAQHISHGMYGMILVEPEGGLPKVDHEFYVMQGELYTLQPTGYHGNQEFSVEKLLSEDPEYFVFNGASKALATQSPLRAKVGETIRIFFGVGGPNYISSFHIIGEVLDRVYLQASLTSPSITNVQTTVVPPGGATIVELKVDVPGRFIMVDHALSRMEKGLIGYLEVEGDPQPDIYHPGTADPKK